MVRNKIFVDDLLREIDEAISLTKIEKTKAMVAGNRSAAIFHDGAITSLEIFREMYSPKPEKKPLIIVPG